MQQHSKCSFSSEETFRIGQLLARELKKSQLVLLEGVLGAGKTQLIKGICHYFGIDPLQVQSPTYGLHHSYFAKDLQIEHFDLYRLKDTNEFIERGFLDTLQASDLCLIEWPSKVDAKLFKNFSTVNVTIKITNETSRMIDITYA